MNKLISTLFLLPLIMNLSCTRSYMVKSESTKVQIERVNVLAVAYHRPDYAPTEHDDFKVKDRVLSCQHPEELWNDAVKNGSSIRECVNSIEKGQATYFYVPAIQPYLELDQEEETNPKCLKTSLTKIPLPREIYYLAKPIGQTFDDDSMGCYSSSFSVKTNEMMSTPTGFLKKKIVLPFPLSRPLMNSHDLSLWLMVTTFTILKSDEKADGRLLATPVPESVCRVCFKNDAHFDEKFNRKLKPVFWP